MAGFMCHTREHLVRYLLALVGMFVWFAATPAMAQVGSARYSSIIINARTGQVLEAVNPDAPRRPASLTKLMTLYLTFEALRDRRINLDDLVPVSRHAASMEPSKLGLVPGTKITVQQLILALVTKSANDAASALGEFLGGSESRFAQMMTLKARALGMHNTTFKNASGLPNPEQFTTARDLSTLARRLILDFPEDYHYFSTPSFTWHGQFIPNHDTMLHSYPGADGMKTGYTDLSGHNLITSAKRDGVRLIGVEMGAASNWERNRQMTALLNQGFTESGVPVPGFRAPATRLALIPTAHAAEVHHPIHPRVARTHPAPRVEQHMARRAPRPHEALVHEAKWVSHTHRAMWAVQVGTFATHAAAERAAMMARRNAAGGIIRLEPVRVAHRRVFWRARLVDVTASHAREACAHRRPGACLIVRPTTRQVASR